MSFWELSLVAVIALIILGPERLPQAARTIGLWVGKAKQGFESIKTEIDRELKVKELQQQLLEQKKEFEDNSGLSSLKEELDNSISNVHNQSESIQNSVISDDSPKIEANKAEESDEKKLLGDYQGHKGEQPHPLDVVETSQASTPADLDDKK